MLWFSPTPSWRGRTTPTGISINANALSLNGGTITDAAGNTATLTAAAVTDNANFKVDTTAPTVSSEAITSATGIQNNYLNAGDVVSVTATFSENETVTGTPQLQLNVGGTLVQANYSSGTGSNALVFTYTILAGQNDANGISINANALSLNGGTITDAAGNAATLTAAAVTDNANFKVDTTAPTITITGEGSGRSSVNGTYVETGSGLSSVTIHDDTSNAFLAGTLTFNSGAGTWTFTFTGTKPGNGDKLVAQATDVAGNVGPNSAQFTAPAGVAGLPIYLGLSDTSADHLGSTTVTISGRPRRLDVERRHQQR
jgi:hypothetical protein